MLHRLFRYLLCHAEVITDHNQNWWAVSAVSEQSVGVSGVWLQLECLLRVQCTLIACILACLEGPGWGARLQWIEWKQICSWITISNKSVKKKVPGEMLHDLSRFQTKAKARNIHVYIHVKSKYIYLHMCYGVHSFLISWCQSQTVHGWRVYFDITKTGILHSDDVFVKHLVIPGHSHSL